jgi:nucleotide-binding universal stress UspA family protein
LSKKYERILVPYDGSDYSKKALEEAVMLANEFDSKIFLITVVEPPQLASLGMYGGYARSGMKMDVENFVIKSSDMIQVSLDRIAKEYSKQGVSIEPQITSGKTAEEILDFAKRKKIDLIVMGAAGLTGLKKIKILGSVSRKIAENSTCPLMLIR